MAENKVTFEMLTIIKEKIEFECKKLTGLFRNEQVGYYTASTMRLISSFNDAFLAFGRTYYNDDTLTLKALDERYKNELASMNKETETLDVTYTDSDKSIDPVKK